MWEKPVSRSCVGRLSREYDADGAHSKEKLYPLYHGMLDVSLPDMTYEGGEYTCTVPLTKDTNHVRVILQHLSGEPVDPADFTFRIEEENGLMEHDNSLLPDEMITYWRTRSSRAPRAWVSMTILSKDAHDRLRRRLRHAPSPP